MFMGRFEYHTGLQYPLKYFMEIKEVLRRHADNIQVLNIILIPVGRYVYEISVEVNCLQHDQVLHTS